ncbi:hypothetical protein GQ55_7G228200 [Panicum hallii var. hallii]|uniref:VOC domain-containing protein n=2 Tax=Panicum hallii TaxID=206008 RepID=A0A2T7CY02_9POAL|nr:uncharacterized protein LOC112901401 [Panicum hallii]PAN39329.1 hypothetical protein PAHAL_7G235800 [Panicum hallii]PUZ48220.1 hypothetical protein GQ55_7G228200 [Panicum hallii var. hallii]
MAMGSDEEPGAAGPALPLVRLNHVSFQCASVEESAAFYQRVLGFQLVTRPASLDFGGAWLHRYGMGIHLLQRGSDPDAPPVARPPAAINPKGNHISFQCADMGLMKARLGDMRLEFVAARVRDGETVVEQLFFHDPDGNMIEICDCEKLPVVPLADAASAGLPDLVVPMPRDVHG